MCNQYQFCIRVFILILNDSDNINGNCLHPSSFPYVAPLAG